jgi:hypothetical protein
LPGVYLPMCCVCYVPGVRGSVSPLVLAGCCILVQDWGLGSFVVLAFDVACLCCEVGMGFAIAARLLLVVAWWLIGSSFPVWMFTSCYLRMCAWVYLGLCASMAVGGALSLCA